ncbi:MAG TPA: ferredoxin [Candidatus Omnitrophota bacterium]|nr:ferredoxin [Candidatus Omnitrophota bacterium]HPN57268.1 ferredoxin [Candidatus Omnitrophota bacterium]
MRAEVDKDLCTGCELCTQTCEEVFRMDDGVAVAAVDLVPEECEDLCQQAADDCPVEAIKIM